MAKNETGTTSSDELIARLREQIIELDEAGVEATTLAALDAGAPAKQIIAEGLGPGMESVGKSFEEGEYFVPELLLSARAMGKALDLLRPHLEGTEGTSPGTVVLGTVQGDVHEIGKSIVGIVLAADGFEVHDLGEDVPPQDFVRKAMEHGADVVGMSALISLAVSKMAETVMMLKESDFGGQVIVGGAALTHESAEGIGADAFAADAWEALRKVRSLVGGLAT
ncbi:MAG: cobalamin-binding protein [bacterium]|nr:cobalamin-binding protein [bacterium]